MSLFDKMFWPNTQEGVEKQLEQLMPTKNYDPATVTLAEHLQMRQQMFPAMEKLLRGSNMNLHLVPDYIPESMFNPAEGDLFHNLPPRFMPLPFRRHEHYEIFYLETGRCMHFIGSDAFLMEAGDVVLIPPGVYHTMAINDWSCTLKCIGLRASTVPQTMAQIFSLDNELSDFFQQTYQAQAQEGYLLCRTKNDPQTLQPLQMLLSNNYHGKPRILPTLLLQAALVAMYPTAQITTKLQLVEQSPGAQLAQYIRRHFATVGRDELSELFSYSERQITRLLKEETGMTFIEYRTEVRMGYVCDMLVNSAVSVNDIVVSAGYHNNNVFYDSFIKRYGVTPMEYRQQHQAR